MIWWLFVHEKNTMVFEIVSLRRFHWGCFIEAVSLRRFHWDGFVEMVLLRRFYWWVILSGFILSGLFWVVYWCGLLCSYCGGYFGWIFLKISCFKKARYPRICWLFHARITSIGLVLLELVLLFCAWDFVEKVLLRQLLRWFYWDGCWDDFRLL